MSNLSRHIQVTVKLTMEFQRLCPDQTNVVGVSMDIDEIMQINDADYIVTISLYFNIQWQEPRLKMLPSFGASSRPNNSMEDVMVPMNLEFVKDLWLPNIFIYKPKDLQSDRRPVEAGGTVDRHGQERAVQPGPPHHLHLPDEVRQVSLSHSDLQVSCWFLLLRHFKTAFYHQKCR